MTLHSLSVADAQRLIAARTLSPVDLVEAFLARIAEVDHLIHSYILVMADQARAAARQAEAEIAAGSWRGPLHGIPFGVKDNYDVAGVPTTGASRLRLDHVATGTATAVRKLQAAGAILLGKLNTWEYGTGTGAVHHDLPFPVARNPWNTGHFTGGSSTGAGASVAAGTAMFALGSDTGGSIRLPAAACGLQGIKPTFGLVSRAGILPNCWSLDVAGPLCWTVEDAAIVLRTIAGFDAADPSSASVPPADYLAGLDSGVRGLRLGIVRQFGYGAPVLDAANAAALEAAATLLAEAGATVIETTLPAPLSQYEAVTSVINWSESYSIHEQDFAERGADMGQALRDKMMSGFTVRAADYLAAQRERRSLALGTDAVMRCFDAVLMPCAMHTAPPFADPDAVTNFTRHKMTTPFNVSGHTWHVRLLRLRPGRAAHQPAGRRSLLRRGDRPARRPRLRACHPVARPPPQPGDRMMADMTPDEMLSYAERHGLTAATPETLARIRELSAHVAATGVSIRRMPDKADEPAGVFCVPLPARVKP